MKTKFIILGCGNSFGTPRIDGYWGKSKKDNSKNFRTRCSALIIKGSNSVLIDTSPDLRHQLLRHKIKKKWFIFRYIIFTLFSTLVIIYIINVEKKFRIYKRKKWYLS